MLKIRKKIRMKIKGLLLLPLALGILSLAGCKNKFEPVKLQYGQMISSELTENDYQQLKERFARKETFLLSVYARNCACWSNFKAAAKPYITKNHVEIFAVNYEAFHSVAGETLDTFGLDIEAGKTSFHVIKEGKVVLNVKSGDSKAMEKSSEFEKMMNDTVVLPKMFYINKTQLDSLYSSNETSAIYFMRSNCGDCTHMNDAFLNKYDAKGNLYILDCEKIGIRQYDSEGNLTPTSQIAWNKFKSDYGLASDNNEKYGYDTGYVPTLMLMKGDATTHEATYLSGAVYFNDSVEKSGEKYVVSNSFYTSERLANLQYLSNFEGTKVLKGLELTEDDVATYEGTTYTYWTQESAEKYHNPLAKAFLDYALPLVTHTSF